MINTIYNSVETTGINQGKKIYDINESFLNKLGFEKRNNMPGPNRSIFRYYNPQKKGKGFDLIFVEEFGILCVEEFGIDPITGHTYFRNTIVGMFHVESDEDLAFIFSKNVRLKFMLNIAKRRRIGY